MTGPIYAYYNESTGMWSALGGPSVFDKIGAGCYVTFGGGTTLQYWYVNKAGSELVISQPSTLAKDGPWVIN